ncbi:hypothetical protein FE391_37755 [Nonomuraea sp. KC401]|uniref:hypothetical protein n=1 Tax=unclassified Nonomuraea TaxID=2593643 RepID=UPI0010FF590B|nr:MULTISPECIES: hypothetical protein [unclassified Nonomuraea]NBE99246.1 hypothetical protein [Nonomuraea sp. K271]TLF57627.1 hypothetical protein FE391_37755 [Nonomuraea sp. KC401]
MIRYWFVPDEYFRAWADCHRAWTWSRGMPALRHRDDLRVLPGELGFGCPRRGRFDVLVRVRMPGLRRQRGDLRLDITLDRHSWRVASPTRQPA